MEIVGSSKTYMLNNVESYSVNRLLQTPRMSKQVSSYSINNQALEFQVYSSISWKHTRTRGIYCCCTYKRRL